eukprot:1157757-Pelagomonas_calceolata.AAC.1
MRSRLLGSKAYPPYQVNPGGSQAGGCASVGNGEWGARMRGVHALPSGKKRSKVLGRKACPPCQASPGGSQPGGYGGGGNGE